MQGENRSVIIILQIAFNAGWRNITFKIDNFMNEYKGAFITNIPRKVDPKIPCENSLRASKLLIKLKVESTPARTLPSLEL